MPPWFSLAPAAVANPERASVNESPDTATGAPAVNQSTTITAVQAELRLNPLYAGEDRGTQMRMRLAFPSEHYEEEYGAVRRYLPEELTLDRATVDAVSEGQRTPQVRELIRRRIVLDMPARYY